MRDQAVGATQEVQELLLLLRDTNRARTISLQAWDKLLRLGRQARLLGALYHRMASIPDLLSAIPTPVLGHLRATRNYSAHRVQMLRMELSALDHVLPADLPVYLLKGASYVVQDVPMAAGRLPGDVDLLVKRADLDRAESVLVKAGWASQVKDAYDQHYYREWSHELPPMRRPGHPLEVDLHHAITPVTSRFQAASDLVFDGAWQPEGLRFWVLHPADQVIHAAVHLFQDSDLVGRLRDLVDIDGLIRHHITSPERWSQLHERAIAHGLERPLWYALRYCEQWLATPSHFPASLPAPPNVEVAFMDWLVRLTCLPQIPDEPPGVSVRLARTIAAGRYHRLRMPPKLLLPHLLRKGWRRLKLKSAE